MAKDDIEALARAVQFKPLLLEGVGAGRLFLALVFTDVVGSTELSEAIKDERMNVVRRAHFAQSRRLINTYGGYEIKTAGDAFMVAFHSADKALDYAIALHNEPGAPELRVRAGIHIGSVSSDEGDVFGRTVNFAARVVGAIKGPEIWVSDEVRTDLDHLGASRFDHLRWDPHDNVSLKGFDGRFRLWSLAPISTQGSSVQTGATTPHRATSAVRERPPRLFNSSRTEFHTAAENYDRVDFVSSAEVVIDAQRERKERGVYAQVDFIERLYVETGLARIEFGVRRAYFSVDNDGPGVLTRADHLRAAETRRNVHFVSLHGTQNGIGLCIDPDPGKTSLAELALPPTPRENYLCQVATATAEVDAKALQAELRVSLDIEGLYLADEVAPRVSLSKQKQIKAIIAVAATKPYHRVEKGEIRRPLEVRERSR